MGKVGMGEREADCRLVDIRNREVGAIAPRSFSHRAAASLDIVLRLGLDWQLKRHTNVNTISFNSSGNIFLSGYNNENVVLWDWDMRLHKLSFDSGHTSSVYQAKFMPYTDDRTMVTCAADGEVRSAQIHDGGHIFTRMLAKHQGPACKIAIEPGSPYILYSCGEDGRVQRIDLRTQTGTELFKCKSFKGKRCRIPIVSLQSIEINPRNQYRFAIAGSDVYARVYDSRMCGQDGTPVDCYCAVDLIGDYRYSIEELAFSDQSELLVSYNYEAIYLFSEDQGLGPDPDSVSLRYTLGLADVVQVYNGRRNFEMMNGVSFFGPNCEYVTCGSNYGCLFFWRKKGGKLLRVMEGDKRAVNCYESNPCTPMIVSCGMEDGFKLWLPNAEEPAAPVDVNEIIKQEPVTFVPSHDMDDDDEDDDDDNDDNDNDEEEDDDGDSANSVDSDYLWSDTNFDENLDDYYDDDDDYYYYEDDGQNDNVMNESYWEQG